MLRYKKHKRHADGLSGSGVGVMDDTDREVSSFTDRAFRSLCVAEEEIFNDVPHIPSPIRGMPLSTKYHLGIFNLSVRKTQPLAQLPSISQHRGKWAPTFQPLLNCAKDRLTVAKTNSNKLCVPQPTGYKPSYKVSSLIKSFDNVENERPEQDGFSPVVLKGKMNMEETSLSQKAEHNDVINEPLDPLNSDNKNPHLHRRTAREVFLESQAEICSKLSGSPCSLGSPLPDQSKKMLHQKASLRRTAFLHSENSAFKSWSDISKRGDDSDSSIPGTPPILRSATPCSPLLQRTTPGVRARDAGLEVGWSSPASTLSNSFDAIQMLRTVPPLPTKRMSKQCRELSHRAPKVHTENKIPAEDMQVDLGNQSPKEQPSILSKSTCPKQINQALNKNQEKEMVSETSQPLQKQNEEIQEKEFSQESNKSETETKEDKLPNKSIPPVGRIKTLIQQIEKESIKEAVPLSLPEKKHIPNDSNEASMETLPSTAHAKPSDVNSTSNNTTHVPPWRRMHVHRKDLEDKLFNKSLESKESSVDQVKENITANEEDTFEDKPSTSFNITNLLTPVIRRKSIQEAIEEQPMAITPPSADTITPNDLDQTEINLYRKRNEYKSKASGLLFNLKDMRKRVKCTYNPSTNHRNGLENNPTAEGRPQDVSTYGIPLIDKRVSEIENVSTTDQEHVPRLTKEEEANHDFLRNASDNYLCLSSPSQAIPCQVFENAQIPTDDVQTNEDIHNEIMPSLHLSPTEHIPKKNVDYPILNLYPKNDAIAKAENKNNAPIEPVWRQKRGELPLQEEIIKPVSRKEDPLDTVSMPTSSFLEGDVKNEESHIKQSLAATENENKCSTESEEGEKQNIKSNSLEDALQYYAVNDGNMESSREEHEIQKEETEEKVEDKELLVGDKQDEESTITAEIKTPSNIIQFKPNLFHIKDNKMKSSPVTKSVRPLFRSLSEDCLLYHKGEDYTFTTGKGDFRVTTPSSWKHRDSKIELCRTRNIEAHNGEKCWNPVATQPVLELPDYNRDYQQIKVEHEDREVQEILEKPCSMTPDWRRNEEETAKLVKLNKSPNKNSSLNGPFFHPVETCISEVAGLSPECNNLLVHHESESMKDLINGEHESSTLLDSTNATYSPLDDGPIHFEDAISFSEDIACSTITSPMSESITCSMVTSPMSVNTQSSGFTTALSALDDIPSPPCTNSRNGKSNLSNHDIMSLDPTPSGNLETKANECIKHPQEKPPCVDSINKAQAAKPPTVPPKTEKALRRAKRLTKKRRKTEIPPKIQEGDFQESDFVLDVPSPANNIPSSTESNFKVGSFVPRTLQQEELMSEPSTPSLPITQRKLLQDPNSGQYFVVDIPVHLRIKTFFDPETGKYLQMSLPTSPTPPLEMSPSPYMMYQGLGPVPVTSIASLKKASQMLNHSDLYSGGKPGSWPDQEDNCLKMQQFIDCDSCDQSMVGTPHSMAGTPQSMDRNAGRSRSPDIISMRDIDDFAMEAIS